MSMKEAAWEKLCLACIFHDRDQNNIKMYQYEVKAENYFSTMAIFVRRFENENQFKY